MGDKSDSKKPNSGITRNAMLPESSKPAGLFESAKRKLRAVLVPAIQPKPAAQEKKYPPPMQNPAGPSPASSASSSVQQDFRSKGMHQISSSETRTARAPVLGFSSPTDKARGGPESNPAFGAGAPSSPPRITRQTSISEIMEKYPEALEVLSATGLQCVGCQLSVFDDLETGLKLHGFEDDFINSVVSKLNETIQNTLAQREKERQEKEKKERAENKEREKIGRKG